MHQVIEAAPFLAEEVVTWHADVLEMQFGGVGGVQAHLVELAPALEARHAAFDDQ